MCVCVLVHIKKKKVDKSVQVLFYFWPCNLHVSYMCCHRINDELSDTEADMRELQSATERAV